MTWEEFRGLFYEKYFNDTVRGAKTEEFVGLVQGKLTVTEYVQTFDRLARFAVAGPRAVAMPHLSPCGPPTDLQHQETFVKSAVETLSPTRAKLTVEVPFEELKPSLDAAYQKIAKQINVPGFRRGKVPPAVIDRQVRTPPTVATSAG